MNIITILEQRVSITKRKSNQECIKKKGERLHKRRAAHYHNTNRSAFQMRRRKRI